MDISTIRPPLQELRGQARQEGAREVCRAGEDLRDVREDILAGVQAAGAHTQGDDALIDGSCKL